MTLPTIAPTGIDPISQMIGALGAQVTNLAAQLSDLRSEIMVNRAKSDEHWIDLEKQLDTIYAEYRTVKHLERGLEQLGIAIDDRLKKLSEDYTKLDRKIDEKHYENEVRLRRIEDTMLQWRAKGGMLLIIGSLFGGLIIFLVQVIAKKWIE